MAKRVKKDLIARAIQKRDRTRVALEKTACGAAMIDGLVFTVSVKSDGAASSKGIMFTVSGEAVEKGALSIDMIDAVYPSGGGTKTIKRKAELYEKKDGGHVYRARFTEIKLEECADAGLLPSAMSEEQLIASMNSQIIFRFAPRYSEPENSEVMINIYPIENPIDGSCTEWVTLTSDRGFFEHGGARNKD